MRKRARRRDPPKVEYNADDFLSPLPKDLLVSNILSRLSLKEAAATSILSKQWSNLWTLLTGLDLRNGGALGRIVSDPKSLNAERSKYINWVNRIVRQHKGPALSSFSICFDLDNTSRRAIDNWIKFAVAKKVQRLDLDLLQYGNRLRLPMRCYSFRLKLFNSSGRQSQSNLGGMRSLRHLSLRCVNVSDQALEFLLLNCPLLGHLSVHGSGDMVNVKVTGQSLRLKTLEIFFCFGIQTVDIRDTNLASFYYLGPRVNLVMENVPMLDVISIGSGHSGIENNVFRKLACCFNHLQILTLVIYRPEENMFANVPNFPKLRELILRIAAWYDNSLLEFTSLMKGSPNLERFVMQLIWVRPQRRRRVIHPGDNFLYRSLKVVEFFGYYGRASDTELVWYFIQNAPALQKLLIVPHNQTLNHSALTEEQIKTEELAIKYAMLQLPPIVPPTVQLVIS